MPPATCLCRDFTAPKRALRILMLRADLGKSGSALRRSYPEGRLETSTIGIVLYLYLLAPHVFLDRLGVGDHVLADTNLFLDHRALLHDDLFLGNRHDDLVVSDLGLGSLALHGNPLHRDLFVAGRDFYLLAVRTHALPNLKLTGLALAGACGELFFCPLNPELRPHRPDHLCGSGVLPHHRRRARGTRPSQCRPWSCQGPTV